MGVLGGVLFERIRYDRDRTGLLREYNKLIQALHSRLMLVEKQEAESTPGPPGPRSYRGRGGPSACSWRPPKVQPDRGDAVAGPDGSLLQVLRSGAPSRVHATCLLARKIHEK